MLQGLPMLEGLTKGQLFALTDVVKRREFSVGTQFDGVFLHILMKGCVQLSDRGALQRCVNTIDAESLSGPVAAIPGDAFGEAACMANGASVMGVEMVATTDVEIMWCDKDTFLRVLGPPEALLVPGAQRKIAHPRQELGSLAEATAPMAYAEGDETGFSMDEVEREKQKAHAFLALPAETVAAVTESRDVQSSDDLLLAASAVPSEHTRSRFRTPNQDVSWHGSSSVRLTCPAFSCLLPDENASAGIACACICCAGCAGCACGASWQSGCGHKSPTIARQDV